MNADLEENRLKTSFVTHRKSNSYKQASKRRPFALQKGTFYTSKGRLLKINREMFLH